MERPHPNAHRAPAAVPCGRAAVVLRRAAHDGAGSLFLGVCHCEFSVLPLWVDHDFGLHLFNGRRHSRTTAEHIRRYSADDADWGRYSRCRYRGAVRQQARVNLTALSALYPAFSMCHTYRLVGRLTTAWAMRAGEIYTFLHRSSPTNMYYDTKTVHTSYIHKLTNVWLQEPTPPPKLASSSLATGQRWRRLTTAIAEFFSAFRHPPFFWLSLQLIFAATEGVVQGLFYLYWFEDVIAPNFTVGGRHITRSTVTALSIIGILGQVGGLVCAPLGAYCGARFERRKVLFVGSAVAVCIPVINALLPTFEWVVLTALLNCVLTGIRGPVGAAFMADCLPSVSGSDSEEGTRTQTVHVAASPAKNMNFLQIVPRLPQVGDSVTRFSLSLLCVICIISRHTHSHSLPGPA